MQRARIWYKLMVTLSSIASDGISSTSYDPGFSLALWEEMKKTFLLEVNAPDSEEDPIFATVSEGRLCSIKSA